MNAVTDQELARRAQSGAAESLAELLTRHRQRVFGLVFRILGHREDALDATQDTCLRVCRHLSSYDPGRPFGAWIRQVAVRAALDLVRRRRGGANGGGISRPVSEAEGLPDPRPDPCRMAANRQLVEAVQGALQGLSPAQRAAFVCRELEGMDTREIAQAMGCLRPTVRWHLFEARRRLADQLARFRGGEP